MQVSGGRRKPYSEDWDTGCLCDYCLIDNENENAQFYCTNCNEFLCDTCATSHRKYKVSRSHQLLDGDEMPKKKISNGQDKICAKHDGKLVEYFCDKHDTFCCNLCVTQYHVQCDVKNIEHLAKVLSQEYKSLLKQIKDTEKQFTEYKNKTQHAIADVYKYFRQFQADIQVFRSNINSKLDVLEKELLQQAEQIKNEDLEDIETMVTLNIKLLGDMSEISSSLGLLEKSKENQQHFISSKEAQTQLKACHDIAQSMRQDNNVRRYAFSRNEDIINTLNSRTLGSLKKENEGEEQTTQDEEKPIKTDIIKTTKFKFTKDIKLKHKADTEELWIRGSVLMYNDLLAVVDSYNFSIKVVDLRSDTITCYIKLDDQPWDITCMDPGTLVVTCDTYLVFLRYDGKLSVIKTVPMESGCSGITNSRSRLFVMFRGKHPSVKIFNNEGKFLQTFTHSGNAQNLFSYPRYITVTNDGDTMYISDYDQNTVKSLSMDGKVCHIYKHDSLRGPRGLFLGDNCVYVVGCLSQNMHQITPTCAPIGIVLNEKDGLSYPQTLVYINTNKTLYVCNGSSSDALLKVYKLE